MLRWLRNRRRRKLRARPFPDAWEKIVEINVAHARWLDGDERAELRDLVKVFVAEKSFEGCGGLDMTDEVRVTIAGQACLLLLGLVHDYYRNVRTILVYPSTVVPPLRTPGAFEIPQAPLERPEPILGQAQLRGPLLLVWDAVRHAGRHARTGHNVVFHEFAHKLDMLDGAADGTPPLRDRAEYGRWIEICGREFHALREASRKGRRTFLDDYGATHEAEFFAVATEQFFDRPMALRRRHPELYGVLQEYYRQDPAARLARAGAEGEAAEAGGDAGH